MYKFVRVSRATGEELEILPMLRGGSITRNNDVRILDTAEVTRVGKFDIGADLVQNGGVGTARLLYSVRSFP